MITDYTDYRQILREKLSERCKTNPRYSLRAFARDIRISVPRLSLILNQKKGLSVSAAKEIAERLGFSEKESSYFCDLVESMHARSRSVKEVAKLRLETRMADLQARTLEADAFKVVADWHHFAVMQLMHLNCFKNDVAWMANALQIHEQEVSLALERLERLQLIEKVDGRYRVIQDYVLSTDGVPSEAIRKFHKQVIEKALVALESQSVDERDFISMMIPIDSKKITRAKELIRKFRQDMIKDLTTEDEKLDEVYSLSVQFAKVTNFKKELK